MSSCPCLIVLCPCVSVSMSPSPCLHFSMSRCIHVCVFMFPCLYLHISMSPCLHVSGIRKKRTELTENSNFICWLQTEPANFCLFAAKGNGKQKFVFLGRQTLNGNRSLLFQQMYSSMHTAECLQTPSSFPLKGDHPFGCWDLFGASCKQPTWITGPHLVHTATWQRHRCTITNHIQCTGIHDQHDCTFSSDRLDGLYVQHSNPTKSRLIRS